MPNISVFSGSDASISLSVDHSVEGDKAKGIIDAYSLTPVARAVNITLKASSDLKPFHETGQLYPNEIKTGNVTITGTIDRAYTNSALLKLLLGDAASGHPAGAWVQPSFNITLILNNPALPGVISSIVVHGVKFQTWIFGIPEDDLVIEKIEFVAAWISVDDKMT